MSQEFIFGLVAWNSGGGGQPGAPGVVQRGFATEIFRGEWRCGDGGPALHSAPSAAVHQWVFQPGGTGGPFVTGSFCCFFCQLVALGRFHVGLDRTLGFGFCEEKLIPTFGERYRGLWTNRLFI